MYNLSNFFLNSFSKFNFHKNIYIGYSGGIDSSVLLYLSCKFFDKKKYSIRVLHINHSYSIFSDSWSIFCKNYCNSYKVPLYLFKSYKNINKNFEQEFRFIRFNFFFDFIFKNSNLLLAHNNDDFFETFFLRLFRGSNFKSVFGIDCQNKIGKLNILRPLISFNKVEIKEFALLHNILNVNDFSNFNIYFKRNYIRYKILPLISIEWPNFYKNILKFYFLSNDFYFYFYFRFFFFFKSKSFNLDFLDIRYLLLLPFSIRNEIIKLWIKFNNYYTPSYAHFKEIDKLLISSSSTFGFIFLKNFILKRIRNYLFLLNVNSITIFFNFSVCFYRLVKIKICYYFYYYSKFFFFDHVILLNNNIFYFFIRFNYFHYLILGLSYSDNFLSGFKNLFIFKFLY